MPAAPPVRALARAALLLSLLVAGAAAAQVQPPDADKPGCVDRDGSPNLEVPNLAANCPDLFAWIKFIEVNSPIPGSRGLVQWQGWATDPDTFPKKPRPDRCDRPKPDPDHCPLWPASAAAEADKLAASKRSPDLHPTIFSAAVLATLKPGAGVPPDLGAVAGETIRRNRAAFDYIVGNELWYREGLARRFAEDFTVDFPLASIELKFNWLPMKYVKDPSRYFTAELEGELQGLVAMHVTTKDLPNWFWATFEHVDNPGRCDFIGCFDSFGVYPAEVPPRRELKTTYRPGKLRAALAAMMRKAGLDPVFANYRLKGSQTDFTDSRGTPTLLGNSVTEYGFVPTASCITCHGRAGVNWNGEQPANLRVFGEKLGGQTFNGPLDPALFHDGGRPARRYLMQVDFIWAIPFRAQPIGGKK